MGTGGELDPRTLKLMLQAGASEKQVKQLLASFLKCVDTVCRADQPLQVPIYQEYRTPGPGPLISTQVLLHQDDVPQFHWWSVGEDHVVWPHLTVLHIIASILPLHLLLPVDREGVRAVVQDNLLAGLYWYQDTEWVKLNDWPRQTRSTGRPTHLIVDTTQPIELRGLYSGRQGWSMEYGYPEHSRYITAVVYDTVSVPTAVLWKSKRLFQVALQMCGLPVSVHQQDYRLAIWQPAQTTW